MLQDKHIIAPSTNNSLFIVIYVDM